VVKGNLFVVGGLGAGGKALSGIELYHPGNSSWTTFAQLPSARSDVDCAASGNNLVVAGGLPAVFFPVLNVGTGSYSAAKPCRVHKPDVQRHTLKRLQQRKPRWQGGGAQVMVIFK